MNWLFFAILSPLIYTANNFIDKYVVSKELKDYRSVTIYTAITSFIFGTAFWIFKGFPELSLRDGLLVVLSGMFTIWATAFYFKALSTEATSKIIILFQMGPVLVLVSSYLFLHDFISAKQLSGFLLILIAVTGISVERIDMKLKLSSAFFLILANQILWTAAVVIFKFVTEGSSFVKTVAYESWGIALGGLLLFVFIASVRNSFLKTLKSLKKYVFVIIFLNEGVFLTARLTAYYAISLGPVALVSVLSGTSVFFAFALGWLLTIIWPKVFQEDITREGLVKKVAFAILAFVGILFIY